MQKKATALGRVVALWKWAVWGLFPAQLICLVNGRDDVREDVFLAKLFYKANFVKVSQYVVVYTAKDQLDVVSL